MRSLTIGFLFLFGLSLNIASAQNSASDADTTTIETQVITDPKTHATTEIVTEKNKGISQSPEGKVKTENVRKVKQTTSRDGKKFESKTEEVYKEELLTPKKSQM